MNPRLIESPRPGASRYRGMTRAASVAGVAAVATLAIGVPAGATTGAAKVDDAKQTTEEHCILHIVGQLESGEYITEDLGCFGTLDEAFASARVVPFDAETRLSDGLRADIANSSASAAASFAIGTHYANANRGGSSITVTGDDCGGGYVNLSAAWINRISSTKNYCPYTRFFDGYDKTGPGVSEETYTGTINLAGQNDISNSIQYAQ